MTWLKGTSTWANICADIAKLACGEMADGSAVTCAAGDQWVRDISTSFDLIRTPTSQDVNTGTLHNRLGYFALMSYTENTTLTPIPLPTFSQSVCRCTTAFNGVPTGVTANRWMVLVAVANTNSVSGNYSTLQVRSLVYDVDSATTVGSQAVTLNSAGAATITFGTKTVSISITDPSGFVMAGSYWIRSFTSVYLGGIDWFGPMWSRRSGNATYTVDPPDGVVTTDWVKDVDISTPVAANPTSVTIGPGGASFLAVIPQGGTFGGLGIKTTTALTGNQYACSWNMAYFKMRLWPDSGANNGRINLDCFGGGQSDGGTYRRIGGQSISAWLRPFGTAGSVSSSAVMQYWMSVKPNKIIIVLNADPGFTGTLTLGGVYSFTPFNYLGGTYDKFPIAVSRIPNGSSTTAAADNPYVFQEMLYYNQVKYQDGSESRDWQDKWMRCDTYWNARNYAASLNSAYTSDGIGFACDHGNGAMFNSYKIPGYMASQGNTSNMGDVVAPNLSNKPNLITSKWRFYSHAIADRPINSSGGAGGATVFASSSPSEIDFPRGYVPATVAAPFLYVPGFYAGDTFGSGDELTDTISGAKWFMAVTYGSPLIYCGLFASMSTGSLAGAAGVAILEE